MKKSIFSWILWLAACGVYAAPALQEGDIIFQDMPSSQSRAVQLATHSPFSHVGLVLFQDNKPYVFEAVGPVKFTRLKDWINQGKGAHFTVRRLKNADEVLTAPVLNRMEAVALGFKGKSYDSFFEWSDDKMYCSEMVWKVYQRSTGLQIGKLQKLKEFDFSNPFARRELEKRYGNHIPWNEEVISPGRIYESGLLYTVESK